MSSNIVINTNFLLSQLLAQISDLGKAVNLGQDIGLVSEIAKVVYPLIYNQNLGRLKHLQRDVDHLKKHLPKEFRIAIKEMRTEHFSKKPHDIKEIPKEIASKKPEMKEAFKKAMEHPNFLQKEGKGEKKIDQKLTSNKENKLSENKPFEKPSFDKVLKDNKVLKRDPVKEKAPKDTQKEPAIQKNSFKEPVRSDIKNTIFPKETFKPSLKEDKPIEKNITKTITNAEKREIVSKIKQTAQELKTLLFTKSEYVPPSKPKVPLTLPFVTFHPKKEKIEMRISEREKLKLKRVSEVEASGEDKKDKQNQN